MPIYTFLDTKTNEEFEESMSIAEKEIFLKKNKHINQLIVKSPGLADPTRVGIKKPDSGFRDLLKEIKKNNSKGLTKSNINTW